MRIKLNQAAIAKLTEDVRKTAEVAINAGIKQAAGQPLDQAVGTVARAMSAAGLEPNRDGIRAKLVEIGWQS